MEPNRTNATVSPVSPLLVKSIEAFYRNLPELLKKHYAKWVAYHGDECVGVGRSETELYQKCLRLGYKEDDFIVLFATNQALYDNEEIPLPPNR